MTTSKTLSAAVNSVSVNTKDFEWKVEMLSNLDWSDCTNMMKDGALDRLVTDFTELQGEIMNVQIWNP